MLHKDNKNPEEHDVFCHAQPPDLRTVSIASSHLQSPTPDILPLLQSLLATLADIDFAYQKDREIILTSATEEPLKQRVIATLAKRHHERRDPYLRKIDKLERQIQRTFA
jgi:hypothetical protein